MRQSCINNKCLTNKKSNNNVDNKIDQKAHLKQLGLK